MQSATVQSDISSMKKTLKKESEGLWQVQSMDFWWYGLHTFKMEPVDWMRVFRANGETDCFIKLLIKDQADKNWFHGYKLTDKGWL